MVNLLFDGTNIMMMGLAVGTDDWNISNQYVGGVVSVLYKIKEVITKFKAEKTFVVFDLGKSVYRQTIYPDYKKGRMSNLNDLEIKKFLKEDELKTQPDKEIRKTLKIELQKINDYMEQSKRFSFRALNQLYLINILPLLGVYVIINNEVEADDTITNFVEQAKDKTIIISTDKDFYQLVDENVSIYRPITDEYITHKTLEKKLGYNKEYIVPVKIVSGDVSDNIDGISKIGEKTAIKIFEEFGLNEQGLFKWATANIITNDVYNKKYKNKETVSKCPECGRNIYNTNIFCTPSCAVFNFLDNDKWNRNNDLMNLEKGPKFKIMEYLIEPRLDNKLLWQNLYLSGLTFLREETELEELMILHE